MQKYGDSEKMFVCEHMNVRVTTIVTKRIDRFKRNFANRLFGRKPQLNSLSRKIP